jgi:F-type H+-transporting ATPase subunit O
LHGIEGRYATSLFSAASKTSKLPAVESDLKALNGLFLRDPAVLTFMENPLINRAAKKGGVDIILADNPKYVIFL